MEPFLHQQKLRWHKVIAFGLALLCALGLAVLHAALPAPWGGSRSAAAQSSAAPLFAPAQMLAGANGGTEPRVAVAPGDSRYIISGGSTDGPSTDGGRASVYASADGGANWRRTDGATAGQVAPFPDVDIVATSTGRLVAAELDQAGINIVVSYSDDAGRRWTGSTGLARFADQDRPWVASGPDDPKTGRPRVYLLFHNAASSNATHEMLIATSADGGASFGLPVPVAPAGSPAWLDLQCADSSGPSSLAVNQTSGRLYAFWGTRHGQLGGCGTLPPEPYTFVAATRVWAASSPDGSLGSWATSLAVDDSAKGNITGMQFSPGAVDNQGNVYVVYTESPHPYPDFTGAAIRVRHAPPDLSSWSPPITIAPTEQPGNALPHIVAGDPGKFDVAYFAGVAQPGRPPLWYATVSQVLDGKSTAPSVTTERLSTVPAYSGTASELMLVCDPGPTGVVVNNLVTCTRSTDVWGVALDGSCKLVVTWPSVSVRSDARLGASIDATWVDTQVDGPNLCSVKSRKPSAATHGPNSHSVGVGSSLPYTGSRGPDVGKGARTTRPWPLELAGLVYATLGGTILYGSRRLGSSPFPGN